MCVSLFVRLLSVIIVFDDVKTSRVRVDNNSNRNSKKNNNNNKNNDNDNNNNNINDDDDNTNDDKNDTERTNQHSLMPRFLNGHYVAWSAGCTNRVGNVNTPPPNVYYVPDNVAFTRMQMAGDRAFIVSPRYKPGVPFTLGYVPLTDCASASKVLKNDWNAKFGCDDNNGFHSVTPYPSLRAHCQFSKHSTKSGARSCDGESLVNIVDVYLGPDGILWVLDIGIVDTLMSADPVRRPTKYNDPRVLGIDVATGNTVHKIPLASLIGPARGVSKTITTARSLRTIAVEYEDDDETDETTNECTTDATTDGSTVDIPVTTTRSTGKNNSENAKGVDESRPCPEECSEGSGGGTGDGSDLTAGGGSDLAAGDGEAADKRPAKPVAVYVGDVAGDPSRGSIAVWLVKDERGVRVTFPPSSVVPADDNCDDDDEDPDRLDAGRNVLHLALLDEPCRAGRSCRYLYFTYGRHPDAYKIAVSSIRERGRRAGRSELRLNACGGAVGNRCVINVGRKPVGPDFRRPLVPVDSAYGHLWYYRDATAVRGSDLYVWDSRRPFHPEQFETVVRGDRGRSVDRGSCSCDNNRDTVKTAVKPRAGDDGEDEDDADEVKRSDETTDDGGAGCDGRKADAEDVRSLRPLTPGCMQITSVDYACDAPEAAAGCRSTLWALHTNVGDWVRGRTGRFGMTALLCPIASAE